MPTGYPRFKENLFASWEQQNGAVSPMISSSRCCRIPHSSAAFQGHCQIYTQSPICFSLLQTHSTGVPPAPRPMFEWQLALREEADLSERWCSVPHPSVLECAGNTSYCSLGNLALRAHGASSDRADQF